MFTKRVLTEHLAEMGIRPDDTLLVHSSMKAIGPVEDGADGVLDVLIAYLDSGLLILPTHTWSRINETYNIFDPRKEPACVGILPNLFMQRHHAPGLEISDHYDKMEAPFLAKGIAAKGQFGEAACFLCDTEGMDLLTSTYLRMNQDLFADARPVPFEWYA